MPEIKQTLGFDASQALNTLAALDAAMQGVRTRFSSTARAMSTFNKEASTTEGVLKRLKTSASGAATQVARLNKAAPAAPGNAAAINQTAANMDKVAAAAKRAGDAGSTAAKKAAKDTNKWTISWQTLGRVVATQAIVRALNAIRNVLRDAVGDAIKFQKAVAEIGTIGDALGGLENIGGMVRRVSDAFNVDLADTAEAAYQTVSNQIASTEKDVESFLGSAAKFAKITKTDMTTAVNLLSGTLNAFGKDVSGAEDAAAKFFNTIKLGRTRAEELAQGMGTINPIAQKLGITMEELNAAVATLTIQGLKTDKVVTQIRGAMQAFLKPTTAMIDAMQELGYETGEQVFEANDLQEAIRLMITQTDGSAASIAKLFPRIRGLTGVLGLATDESEHFVKSLKEQKEALGETYDKAYELVITTDAEKVTKSVRKLNNALVTTFGQRVLSAAARLFGNLEGLVTSETDHITAAYALRSKEHADALQKELANEKDTINERAKLLAQHAAVARSAFFEAARAAEEANSIIAASSTWAIESMMGPVEAAVSAITKAIAESGKLQQAFADSATSTHEDLQKTIFGRAISVTDDPNVKVAMLRKKSAEESVKAQLLAASATTDAELKVAEALQKSSKAYNDQAFAISRSITKKWVNGKATRDLTKRELELQKRLTSGVTQTAVLLQDNYRKATLKGADAVKKGAKGLAESGRGIIEYKANLENLIEKMQEAQEAASDKDLTPEDQTKLAAEAQTAVDNYLDTYAKGVKKFAESADPLVRKLFQDIEAQDMTVEIETIMTLPSNMQEIFGMIRSAADAYFEKIPTEIQLFAKEKGLPTDTPKQVDEATSKFTKTLLENAEASEIVRGAQDKLDLRLKVLKDTMASLKEETPGEVLRELGEAALKGPARAIAEINDKKQQLTEVAGVFESIRGGLTEGFKPGELPVITKQLEHLANRGLYAKGALQAFNDLLIEVPALRKAAAKNLEGTFATDLVKLPQMSPGLSQMVLADYQKTGAAIDANKAKIDATTQAQKTLNQATKEGAVETSAEPVKQTDVAVKQLETSERTVGTAIDANVAAQDAVTAATDRSTAAAVRHLSVIKSIRNVPKIIKNPGVDFNALGGRMGYFANGGQGTDVINAMLSKGETVTNARSSRRFFSQLQAINAGQNPVYRSEGGDTFNTTVGDINVSGGGNPQQAAREVMKAIRREERRGSGR